MQDLHGALCAQIDADCFIEWRDVALFGQELLQQYGCSVCILLLGAAVVLADLFVFCVVTLSKSVGWM